MSNQPHLPPGTVYLASQSPRRAELLRQIGVGHVPLLAGPGEDAEALEEALAGEAPARYVRRVTEHKLDAALERHAARRLAPGPVLCADTTVALGAQILGKPAGADDARRMLRTLSGRTHRVLTAVAVGVAGGAAVAGGDGNATPRLQALSVSRVRFAALSEEDIGAYLATGEFDGKAGAYAVQGRAGAYIAHLSGSYSGVVGLPLHETALLLRRAGVCVDR